MPPTTPTTTTPQSQPEQKQKPLTWLDLYLRFEGILFLVLSISGFAFPSGMASMFRYPDLSNLDNEQITMITQFTSHIINLYTYYLSFLALFQCLCAFLAVKTNDHQSKRSIISLLMFSTFGGVALNTWVLYSKSNLFNEEGVYNITISYIISIVDFLILTGLTYFSNSNNLIIGGSSSSSDGSSKKSDKKKKQK
eukprot:gene9068-11106_t